MEGILQVATRKSVQQRRGKENTLRQLEFTNIYSLQRTSKRLIHFQFLFEYMYNMTGKRERERESVLFLWSSLDCDEPTKRKKEWGVFWEVISSIPLENPKEPLNHWGRDIAKGVSSILFVCLGEWEEKTSFGEYIPFLHFDYYSSTDDGQYLVIVEEMFYMLKRIDWIKYGFGSSWVDEFHTIYKTCYQKSS